MATGEPSAQLRMEACGALPGRLAYVRNGPFAATKMLRAYDLVNAVHGSSLQFLSTAALALLLCDPCATVTKDPDDIGIVQWRPAFYIVGDLGNACPPVLAFPHLT